MPADRPDNHDSRTQKPSVIDLVTDPEQFDKWQRQREREEASDDRATDPGGHSGRGDDPRDAPSDRRS